MFALATDYYAVAAQVMPLFYVVVLVEAKFFSGIEEMLGDLKDDPAKASELMTRTWVLVFLVAGILTSLVLGEVQALRVLANGSASAAQDGYVICGLVTGGALLVWFPMRVPLRYLSGGTGSSKVLGDIGRAALALVLAVAAWGPWVYVLVDLLGGI